MKGLRFLLIGLAICLANRVNAQFHDSADDVYYYVEYKDGNYVDDGKVLIFNFDGRKGALLSHQEGQRVDKIEDVKNNIKRSPNYYEDKIETTEYNLTFVSENSYKWNNNYSLQQNRVGSFGSIPMTIHFKDIWTFSFSSNRSLCYFKWEQNPDQFFQPSSWTTIFKKVDKSYFKVGRSRTPSETIYE